jgi:hypothetical protein
MLVKVHVVGGQEASYLHYRAILAKQTSVF